MKSASEEYRKVTERMGERIVGLTYFLLNNKNFVPYFRKIRATEPEILIITAAEDDTISVMVKLSE